MFFHNLFTFMILKDILNGYKNYTCLKLVTTRVDFH
eukprot:UN27114